MIGLQPRQPWPLGSSKRQGWLTVVLVALAGCQPAKQTDLTASKKPRPIEVLTLAVGQPPSAAPVSAAASSWKTESIGFEVAGRVEWVLEPGTDVEGRIVGEDGQILVEGTPIARLESERYRLQVESAIAEVARAEQSVAAVNIEIEKSLPSQMRAAQAERQLAETELARSRRLVQQNAGAVADVDRDQARFENARSQIEQLEANLKAKQAELVSLTLQVQKAEQAKRDAERSLEDCTLYSSFRGQIAAVEVVPGSVVSAGQPVATVQMMDPIKIEVEVSAEASRRLRKRQRLPVMVAQADGSQQMKDGFLYLIDPTADPQTRTFTLTLLMLNERSLLDGVESADRQLPLTDQMWRIDFQFLPGIEEGKYYVAEEALRRDAEGPFVWRVLDMTVAENLPEGNIIQVAKMRVELGASRIPFLGNWVFQEIAVKDSTFDPNLNLVAGKLTVAEGDPDDWVGDRIRVDRDMQWKVRPGDLVQVDLSDGTSQPGLYVPMDAIAHQDGSNYVYVVESADGQATVHRREVAIETADNTLSSMLRIRSVDGESDLVGRQIATRGVHYLRDGEPVRVSESGAAL